MAEQSDVSALLEALSPEQLALMVALNVKQNGNAVVIDPGNLGVGMGSPVIAKVSANKGADGGEWLEISVHEPQRPAGYYIVHDARLMTDSVAYWNQADGSWRTDHRPESGRADGDFTVVEAIPTSL